MKDYYDEAERLLKKDKYSLVKLKLKKVYNHWDNN